MFNKRVIRIVAIVMAALMLLGVFGAAISAFAATDIQVSYSNPATGQRNPIVPVIIGIIAFLAAVVCLIISKKGKKNTSDDAESDYIEEENVEKNLNFFTSKKPDTFVEKPEDESED